MTDPFNDCLAAVLKEEGGYVNNPRDPGGMTNLGVTKRVWEKWCGHTASEAEMRSLSVAKVTPLYRAQYWNAVCGDQLPGALALCVFDFAVNAGPRRAGQTLQRLVSASQDGQIGPATLRAVQQYVTGHSLADTVRQYQNARRGFYRGLDGFVHFGKGWLNRCDRVETEALRLVR